MLNIIIGDRVKIINNLERKYIGKTGKVMHIGNKPKPMAPNVIYPTRQEKPYYNIELDDGELLQYVK